MPDYRYTEFTSDDLDQLNLLMRAFPHVAHGFRAVITVSRGLSFPVESPEALQEVVAKYGLGEDPESAIPVDEIPSLMPPYYFPITDQDDFLQKVTDAVARIREPSGRGMPTVVLREAVASRRGDPPDVSVEETLKYAGLATEHRSPSVGGISGRAKGA